jgi:hypothetical protein
MQGAITNNTNMSTVQRKEWATILIANAWNIWLARKQKAFDGTTLPAWRLEENCKETIMLWANRCNKILRRQAIKD